MAACKKFRAKNHQRIILRKSEGFAPDVVVFIESELVLSILRWALGIGRISRAFGHLFFRFLRNIFVSLCCADAFIDLEVILKMSIFGIFWHFF